MTTAAAPQKQGLEDIVAATSKICFIDGKRGKLIYCGYDIHDLVNATFEEVAWLLYHGALPNSRELEEFKIDLAAKRRLPKEVLEFLKTVPSNVTPMEALRTAISEMGLYDPDAAVDATDLEASRRKAMRLLAQTATIVAADDRIRHGKEPISPRPDLSHAANFLYMLTGEEPDPEIARIFDICLILHADHELNASTFSARVTAATLSDIHSAVTSAVGTLKGPLHGGANEQVMRMLLKIGDADHVEEWIKNALANKVKIMGFGHRVYKTMDPRAVHLKKFSKLMCERVGEPKWYEMSEKIETEVLKQKGLYPNVDFYSASTYYCMRIPIDLFTPIFAISRVAGWTAHVLEQYSNNRLIRPMADYTGPVDLKFVSLADR